MPFMLFLFRYYYKLFYNPHRFFFRQFFFLMSFHLYQVKWHFQFHNLAFKRQYWTLRISDGIQYSSLHCNDPAQLLVLGQDVSQFCRKEDAASRPWNSVLGDIQDNRHSPRHSARTRNSLLTVPSKGDKGAEEAYAVSVCSLLHCNGSADIRQQHRCIHEMHQIHIPHRIGA